MLSAIKCVRMWLSFLQLCLILAAPISCLAENLKVLVVLSNARAPYHSFVDSLNNSLPSSVKTTVLEHPEQLADNYTHSDLIVAVGMRATEIAADQNNVPVLAVMIPRMSYEDLLAQSEKKTNRHSISAIYIDQPLVRQIAFVRAALPNLRRIGLLLSPDTHINITSLGQDVAQRGGSLVVQPVLSADNLFSNLQSILARSDVLIAIPDSMIYNNNSIRNILLTSYRQGVPLVGLSQSYVNAGALGAIFSTPEQLAEQAVATVISFAQNRQLPEPQYPDGFTIAVNQQVARSLEIIVPSTEKIRILMSYKANGE
jgi:putative ABC transport system substrate-binding protein